MGDSIEPQANTLASAFNDLKILNDLMCAPSAPFKSWLQAWSSYINQNKFVIIYILDATAYSGSNYFGIGVGRIELNEVDCTGRESSLLGCHHFKLGDYHHCSHNNDAGVRCEGM